MGFFDGFMGFGPSPAQRREAEVKRREREIVSDLGPRAGLSRLREEYPGRYDSTTPADLDRTGPDE